MILNQQSDAIIELETVGWEARAKPLWYAIPGVFPFLVEDFICSVQPRILDESELEDESGTASGSTQSSSRSSSPFDVIMKDELDNQKSELELFRDKLGPELSPDQAEKVSRLVRKEDFRFSFEAAKSLTGGQVRVTFLAP